MLLDRAWSFTFRNFSTLLLIVGFVTLPLHLGYNFAFRDVAAVRPLRSEIERFPEYRQVRSVGPTELRNARIAYAVLTLIELASVPLLLAAFGAVVDAERKGTVPTAIGAWRAGLRRVRESMRLPREQWGVLLAAGVTAFVIAVLVTALGALVSEAVPADLDFLVFGLTQAAARAVAAPFVLSLLVLEP